MAGRDRRRVGGPGSDGSGRGNGDGAEFEAEPGVAHLYAMWVAPDARGAGVGRALLEAVAGWARGRGCERLVLRVTETNELARRFYAGCGFAETGVREPLREGSEQDVLVLSRPL
jgi:ribosomal protein S18 acetylase RimI-like enzyme